MLPDLSRPDEAHGPRVAPLSFAQGRLWLVDRLFPGEAIYNELVVLRFAGTLDADALTRALNEVIRRHEGLRTRFTVRDGEPVQTIAPTLAIALQLDDLTALPPEARDTEARARSRVDARAPFDLERGPLIRARLVCGCGDAEHWLALAVHHIVTDGWSLDVLLARARARATRAFAEARPSPLPRSRCSTRTTPRGSATRCAATRWTRRSTYWKRALDGVAALELPTDRPRPRGGRSRGRAASTFAVDAPLAARLKALARRRRATTFMTLLAAFAACCCIACAAQDDVAVGTPVAGRGATGARAADRLLRQHARDARRPRRRADASPTLLERVRDTRARRARAPGRAVRARRRGARAARATRRAIRCSRSRSRCASATPRDLALAGATRRGRDAASCTSARSSTSR